MAGKATGKCPMCGTGELDDTHVNCDDCRAGRTAAAINRKKKTFGGRRCLHCDEHAAGGRAYCKECAVKEPYCRRNENVAPIPGGAKKGKCIRCRSAYAAGPMSLRCPECRAARDEGKPSRDTCRYCKKAKAEEGHGGCAPCREKKNNYHAEWAARRKEAGICIHCNNPPEKGRTLCATHLRKSSEYGKALRASQASGKQKLCRRCQKAEVPAGYTNCDGCSRERVRASARGRFLKTKAAGRCYKCNGPADREAVTCTSCRDKDAGKRRAMKKEVIGAYGGRCACCFEDRIDVLSLDHKNCDGNAFRKKNPSMAAGYNFYKYVRRVGFPDDLQALCFTCQQGRKLNNGVCPHEWARSMTGDGMGV